MSIIPRILKDDFNTIQRAFDQVKFLIDQLTTKSITKEPSRILTVTLPGTATDTVITHALGSTPTGRVILKQDANAVIWDSAEATQTTITLRSSAAVTVTILLIK